MDSDDSNISDHVGDLDIQLYQFEPLCNDESQQERERSTSEDSDIDESSQAQDRLVNTDRYLELPKSPYFYRNSPRYYRNPYQIFWNSSQMER